MYIRTELCSKKNFLLDDLNKLCKIVLTVAQLGWYQQICSGLNAIKIQIPHGKLITKCPHW